ncbi:PIG-L family deacetylase [Herbiconiux daphne]|uniref:PIG-L family deacetylase n=1 Tax=Herbiconiux daphne TaxID=2970914 RepID=A0ABT2H645_9MICO|nr:PIG-L family deacetylase [Herbiconiux daphne]MCS5735387.1 PIG-L family deacetylase [Herbiconiux daphne]
MNALPDPAPLVRAFGDAPVFLHAHPDDESISTGGTIAALIEAGATVTVLTGTRGERGEVVPGELHGLEGTDELAPHRVDELAAALAALGGPRHAFLGEAPARAPGLPAREYSDSGMRWGADGFAEPADDAAPHSLSLAPLGEVVDDVLAAAGRPTAVVSYDPVGGYGHPDHVRMHYAALEVARRLGIPFFAIVEPRVEARVEAPSGLPAGRELTVELGDLVATKIRAMAAHRTQLTIDGPDFVLSGGQRHPVAVVERFRRVT